MTIETMQSTLTNRFHLIGKVGPMTWFRHVIDAIREFLDELDALPPKADILEAIENALKKVFAGIDTPGPDALVEPAIIQAILVVAAYAYDQLAENRGVAL